MNSKYFREVVVCSTATGGLVVVVVVVFVVVLPFQIRTINTRKNLCLDTSLEKRSHLDDLFLLFQFFPFPCPDTMNMSSSPLLSLFLRFSALLFCCNVVLAIEVDVATGNDLMSFVTVSMVNALRCFSSSKTCLVGSSVGFSPC